MALWRGPDLIFEMVNPEYQAIFGERRLLGKPLIEAIPELEDQEFPKILLRVLETGEPFVGHEVLARLAPREDAPLEDHYYDFTYVRINDVNGKPWGVYDHAIDVTDRVLTRRRNQELFEQNEKLLESERANRIRLEEAGRAKDEFLITLSHELRTPLSAILGWSQLLRQGKPSPDELEEGLSSIEKNARIQNVLIGDLIDMGRSIGGNLRLNIRSSKIESFVQAAIDTVTPAASAKDIALAAQIDENETVRVDPDRMQQVIWNLLANAIKFTPEGGKVRIVAEQVGSAIEIAVTDNGDGIPSDILPRIFDRFRQGDASTSRKYGGMGLGLSIVKQLVELHGGTVEAHSEGKGRGSRFIVRLPVPA